MAMANVPSFVRFSQLPEDLALRVMSYAGKGELRALSVASRALAALTQETCREACVRENFLPPENLREGFNYRQLFLRFPEAISPAAWREDIGEIENVPPIPRNYIEHPRQGCKLVYTPDYVSIAVRAGSPLMLEGRRLIEAPERSPEGARKIIVPITPNNIIFLAQKHQKQNSFDGIHENSWQAVLAQHGDVGVPSHWSYQQEALVGLGESYANQRQMAGAVGLEIVPLIDRLVLDLLSYIHFGKVPQSIYTARTSTVTINYNGHSSEAFKSTIWWPSSPLLFRLRFFANADYRDVGAAVGVPPVLEEGGR